MTKIWSLEWSKGRTEVHAAGGALGHTEFRLNDGRWAAPFHEAPWIVRGQAVEPTMLANLRGEWACLPFGRLYGASDGLPGEWASSAAALLPAEDAPIDASDYLLHGFGWGADWSLVSRSEEGLVITVAYPKTSPIERMTRTYSPVAGAAAMDLSVEIRARRRCRRPFGFHPNFALGGDPGTFRIEPGRFEFGLTHPTGEEGVSRAKSDTRFSDLRSVPLKAGGDGRFDLLPFAHDTEEIVQLCGIDGSVRLIDTSANVIWSLTWDADVMPSCLLWMSNRGREYAPWDGENLCVGVEPVISAFDLGSVASAASNPIASRGVPTAALFEPGVPKTFRYRIGANALVRD
jgi:hypothetical protein